MADVTKTIGTGGDYATMTAWEADITNTTYPSAGTTAVGELITAKDYDEALDINFSSTNVTAYRLTVNASVRHRGTRTTATGVSQTTCARSINTAIFKYINIACNTANKTGTIEFLEIAGHNVSSTADTYSGIQVTGLVHTVNIYSCVIEDIIGYTGKTAAGIIMSSGGTKTVNIHNCSIFRIVGVGEKGQAHGVRVVGGTTTCRNCSVFFVINFINGSGSFAYGYSAASGSLICINCVAGNVALAATSVDFGGTAASSNYNCSEDATAPGANSLPNTSIANMGFVSTTNDAEDLHITSSSVLRDAGTDLSGSGVTTDIDNQTRPSFTTSYDIGADEYSIRPSVLSVTASLPTLSVLRDYTLNLNSISLLVSLANVNVSINEVLNLDSVSALVSLLDIDVVIDAIVNLDVLNLNISLANITLEVESEEISSGGGGSLVGYGKKRKSKRRVRRLLLTDFDVNGIKRFLCLKNYIILGIIRISAFADFKVKVIKRFDYKVDTPLFGLLENKVDELKLVTGKSRFYINTVHDLVSKKYFRNSLFVQEDVKGKILFNTSNELGLVSGTRKFSIESFNSLGGIKRSSLVDQKLVRGVRDRTKIFIALDLLNTDFKK